MITPVPIRNRLDVLEACRNADSLEAASKAVARGHLHPSDREGWACAAVSGVQGGAVVSENSTITKPLVTAKTQVLWVPLPFPGLNDVIGEASRSHHGWNRMKQKWGRTLVLYARQQRFDRIATPAHFEFEFIEPNRRRDPDNVVAGGVKIALDALVQAGLLDDDGWDEVASILPSWRVDKEAPGVRLTVREVATAELGAGRTVGR